MTVRGWIPNAVPDSLRRNANQNSPNPTRVPQPYESPRSAAREALEDWNPLPGDPLFQRLVPRPFSAAETYQRQHTRFTQLPRLSPNPGDEDAWEAERKLPSHPSQIRGGSVDPSTPLDAGGNSWIPGLPKPNFTPSGPSVAGPTTPQFAPKLPSAT
ncbi:MAG: hypothetical protein ACI9G1_000701, partial [Pirellulaceae bacterium]